MTCISTVHSLAAHPTITPLNDVRRHQHSLLSSKTQEYSFKGFGKWTIQD